MARLSMGESNPGMLRSRQSVPNLANLSREYISNTSTDSFDRPFRRGSLRDQQRFSASQRDLASMDEASELEGKRKRFDGSLPYARDPTAGRMSPISEADNPLAGLHELDNTSFDVMNRSLEAIVHERRQGSSGDMGSFDRKQSKDWKNVFAMKNRTPKNEDKSNRSSRRISITGGGRGGTPKRLAHVASLNEGEMQVMQSRVAALEMENLEVQALRDKVKELESALHVVKKDGTRVGLETPPIPRRR